MKFSLSDIQLVTCQQQGCVYRVRVKHIPTGLVKMDYGPTKQLAKDLAIQGLEKKWKETYFVTDLFQGNKVVRCLCGADILGKFIHDSSCPKHKVEVI